MPTIAPQRVLIDVSGASSDDIAKAVADYLAAHPVEAPVASVNSKTGTVVLTAADVKADPAGTAQRLVDALNIPDVPDWAMQTQKPTYTASEVGAMPADAAIPAAPEDIGAQPAGNYAYKSDIPKVPIWAMQPNRPVYTANDVDAITSHGIFGAKVGDLMQITAMDAQGVPTALKPTTLEELEGKWELIETIDLTAGGPVSRTTAPDWTPYSFKAVRLRVKFGPNIEGFGGPLFAIKNEAKQDVSIFNLTPNAGDYEALIYVKREYGLFMTYAIRPTDPTWATKLESTSTSSNLTNGGHITEVSASADLPAGSSVEILGVWSE